MLTLNYRDAQPIYRQIRDGIRRMIVTGALGPDEKLPSVRSMATDLAINPNTIQRAYAELEDEGYIYSVPGKGSFAAPGREGELDRRKERLLEMLRELLTELKYLNMTGGEITAVVQEVWGQ